VNTSLNYELRQLKQQETTLLKLLLDHLVTCPMPETVLAALTPASKADSDGSVDPDEPATAKTGVVQSVQK